MGLELHEAKWFQGHDSRGRIKFGRTLDGYSGGADGFCSGTNWINEHHGAYLETRSELL